MALKKYHVSPNLFDPNLTRYHMGKGTNNRIGAVSNGAMFYIEATPNVQYSIKVYTEDNTFVRLYLSDEPIEEDVVNILYDVISESETTTNPTVTITNTNYNYLWIQVGGTWYTNHGGTSIMLNEGNTALPLEPYGGTWNDIPYRRYETATDVVTNLPVTVYGDGETDISLLIKGNTETSGTPTSSNPVAVNGVGEHTINMCNVSYDTVYNQGTSSAYQYTINSDKTITIPEGKAMYSGFKIKVSPSTTYTIHCAASSNGQMRLREYSAPITDWTTNYIKQSVNVTIKQPGEGYGTVSFTTTAETEWVIFHWYIDPSYSPCTLSEIMMVQGNYNRYTLPTYEPYGYKIPISTAQGSAVNYLGSVQSTRQIGKIVFDGTESFSKNSDSGSSARYYIDVADMKSYTVDLLSTHYTQSNTYDVNTIRTYQTQLYFSVDKTIYATTTDFQTYLQQQYAAGTPVTVWYVLATEETGIVNEPLMKIGDYSDSIDSTQSGVTIPTTGGEVSIDVDTTIKPSELDLTYHGWHEHQPLKRENGQWE